jgi:dolichol-phosphate mannosyltransferase
MKEANFVSAVLYVRNDENGLKKSLNILLSTLSENFTNFEIICVNDSSIDNSAEIIKQAAKDVAFAITLMSTGFYQGLERSMTAGVDLAIGDLIFEFDSAVFAFEPSLIMDIYKRCLQGYDIVSASSGIMCGTSKFFYSWFNRYSHTQYPLVTEDFRIISRRAINRVNQMSRIIPYRKVMYANCGLKSSNIQYKPNGKAQSLKHEPAEKSFRRKLAVDSFILFTDIAYKISFVLAMLMLSVSLFSILYTLAVFVGGSPVLGWTTNMLLLSVGLFGIFAIMTFIVKYLSVILNLVFEKRKYVIGNIEKLQ